MIMHTQALPTVFALSLIDSVGIIDVEDPGRKRTEMANRLINFQQMAITCSFEESMIAWYSVDLTDEQYEALKVVYKSTRPWMLGHVVGTLLNKLDGKMSHKDFAESVRTIVEQLTKNDNDGDRKPSQAVNGLLVKLAKVD